jgi:tonB family C-terminal domain
MKFYIISIILNIMVLFIPAVYYTSSGREKENERKETMTVNLNESLFNDTSEKSGQESEGPVFSGRNKENTGVQEVSASSQPQQNKNIVSNQNMQQNNKKVENTSAISQNKTEQPKVSNSDSKAPVSQNSSLSAVQPSGNTGKTVQSSGGNSSGNTNSSVSGSGNTADASHSGQISGNHATTGSVNGHSSKGSGKSSGESGEGKNTNVCNEGKDFTVSYNPNLKYPVAAQRLGNKGTVVVMVRFRFNSSGSVSVISVSGGSGVFQQEAKSAASRIRVNIKNPDTLKCTISKPFKFELN